VYATTRSVASGDPDAVARLYEAKFAYVFAMVKRSGGLNDEDAMDVLQDVMLKVIRTIRPVRSERALDAFLTRVSRSCAYDHLRKKLRQVKREQTHVTHGLIALTADARLAQEEALAALRRELGGLDRVTRDIIDMRYRASMTLAVIGGHLGMSPGAVHGRLRRGLMKMGASVEAHDRDGGANE